MAYTAGQVREIVTDAQASPRLTAWEQGFMASMLEMLERQGDDLELTPKQAEALSKIEAKLYATG